MKAQLISFALRLAGVIVISSVSVCAKKATEKYLNKYETSRKDEKLLKIKNQG